MNQKRNMKKIALMMAITTPLFLSACGGGGGSSSTTPMAQLTTQSINGFTIPALGVRTSVNVAAMASSDLPVSYTTTTPTICTVSGNTITGVSFGTCGITANQAGNTTFSAAQAVTQSVVVGAQTISLSMPSLMVGQTFPITATATSGFPVTLTSQTPTVCTISGMLLQVISTVPGSCIFTVAQVGNSQYSAIAPISVGATVDAASQMVASGATPPIYSLPQTGSTTADSSTTLEGIYENAQGFGFIDNQNNFDYFNPSSTLFGHLQISGSTWSLASSSILYKGSQYTNVNPISNGVETATNVGLSATGSGLFSAKGVFVASSQSFTTTPSPLTLAYSSSNGYAISQSSVAGNWLFNTGDVQFQLSISNTGAVTGTFTNAIGNLCALTGSLLLADANTGHNLFNVSLQSATVPNSGSKCTIDSTVFNGLGGIRFFGATSNSANGTIPAISFILLNSNTANFPLELFKQ